MYNTYIAHTVYNQNFDCITAWYKDPCLKNENLMVEVRLGILNEHVQHLFAICQQISLNSGFSENGLLPQEILLKSVSVQLTNFDTVLGYTKIGKVNRFTNQ